MTAAAPARPAAPSRARSRLVGLSVVALVAWAALTLDVRLGKLAELPAGLWRIVRRMYFDGGPDLGYLDTALIHMVESIQIAWVGTVIGAALSLPLGFLAAKNVSRGVVADAVRQLLSAIRAVPELVLAVAVFIPIAGLGPVAGALAIGGHSIGTLGKLTAEVIEGIDPGPIEATRALGGSALQVQRWGVLPQVLPEIVALWLYRFEINIRAAAVLGVVGAGGIGFVVQQAIVFGRFPQAGTALLVVVAVTLLVDAVSGRLRRRIIEGADGVAR